MMLIIPRQLLISKLHEKTLIPKNSNNPKISIKFSEDATVRPYGQPLFLSENVVEPVGLGRSSLPPTPKKFTEKEKRRVVK